MSEHNQARRSFLIGSALGVGAVAGAAALPDEAAAKTDAARSHGSTATAAGRGVFLTDDEMATVTAIAERIMPAGPGMAGATDADVVNYIDLALAGAYADQQEVYRRGLAALDGFCVATFKQGFVYLPAAQQDEILTALEAGKATGFTWPSAQIFFNTLRAHTMEGMFADPVYGGNRDFAGWRLVGFPGAQRIYTTADLKSSDAFRRAPITGLRTVGKAPAKRR
jgi:gluconate 2-dehydrogenase gamma chain